MKASPKGLVRDSILDRDLSGKSVLVVAADPRIPIWRAAARGAILAVGVSVDPECIAQARLDAESRGLEVTFLAMDIEAAAPDGRFDIVLCLDVLQTVRNPMEVIDRLIGACREELIVDVPGPDAPGAQEYLQEIGIPRSQRRRLNRLPVILVGRNGTTTKHRESKFYFTQPALSNLLEHHRRHFTSVQIEETVHGHIRVDARRRLRVRRLIVVAGASASGKSTFIRDIQKNNLPEIKVQLGIRPFESYEEAGSTRFPSAPVVDQVIFHYDFLRIRRCPTQTFERDETLELLPVSEEIVFVTMWAPPELLLARVQSRTARLKVFRRELRKNRFRFLFRSLRHARLHRFSFSKLRLLLSAIWTFGGPNLRQIPIEEKNEDFYQSPGRVLDHYRRWFCFAATFGPKAHWIADTSTSQTRLYPVSEWFQRYGGMSLPDSEIISPAGSKTEPSTAHIYGQG